LAAAGMNATRPRTGGEWQGKYSGGQTGTYLKAWSSSAIAARIAAAGRVSV
jgi:hypothetical protein